MTDDAASTCDCCGDVAHHGNYHGDEWVCRWCEFIWKDDVAIVSGRGAKCTCGNWVKFRSKETDRWGCHGCCATFRAGECPECGDVAHLDNGVCYTCLGDALGGNA
jgi:hypothetical protein